MESNTLFLEAENPNIIKISVIPELINKFNVISIKNTSCFFPPKLTRVVSKIHWVKNLSGV